ncbi:MAG: TadE/TadG family type IV pilus assembly protein [Candidatus Korobacteraceae bacterium]
MKVRQRQYGAVLVEAAIALPVFFLLLIGVVEFGRAFNLYQVMTDAAREGARLAVAPAANSSSLPTTEEVRTEVFRFLDSASVPRSVTTVNVNQTSRTVNSVTTSFTEVVVQSSYVFHFLPIPQLQLTAQAEMRNETN